MKEKNELIAETFRKFFMEGKKEESVLYVLELLKDKKMDVIELYEEILAPSLNGDFSKEDKKVRIWNEHMRSGIIRTIVESSYPYVLEKKRELNLAKNLTGVMLCPPEEYHDIGARMAADFLLICGVETVFIGANTPYEDCIEAIGVTKPDVIGISISNYYNLIGAERMIEKLRETVDYKMTIIVGGSALAGNDGIGNRLKADAEVYRFEDIKHVVEKLLKEQKTGGEL